MPHNLQPVIDAIENDGFDYCFAHCSSFKEIDDKEFHRKCKEFLKAREELAEYLRDAGYELST